MLTAAVFGAGALNSAFVTAFTLPNLFRRLLGEGALTSALVPTVSEELDENGRTEAFALVNKVVSWLLAVTGGLVVIGLSLMAAVRMIDGLDERWYVGAHLAQILFPYLIVVCTAAAFGAVLNVLDSFVAPALSSVWFNLSIILALGGGGSLLANTPMQRMYWLCGGVLFGGVLQMVVPGVFLWKKGWRPRLDFSPTPRFEELVQLMVPGVFGTAIFQINVLTSRGLAFGLNESAATLLYLANRLMEVPLGIFTIAVSTVTFPLIARLAAKEDSAGVAKAYHRAMLLTMHIALPASVGLIVLARPIVTLLFQRGAFGGADTAAMIPVLIIFSLGLPFYSYVTLVIRAFYSYKDTKTPVKIAAGAFLLNLALSLILMRHYGTNGLALASNLAVVAQTIVLQSILGHRHPELKISAQFRGLAGALALALVMGAVVVGGTYVVGGLGLSSFAAAVISVGLLIPLGAAAYFGFGMLFRVDGLDEARVLIARFRGR